MATRWAIGFAMLILFSAACGGLGDGGAGGGDGGGAGGSGGSGGSGGGSASLDPELLDRVDTVIEGADMARRALEALGILPVYTCGATRGTFVGEAANGLEASYSCVTATITAGTTQDDLTLDFGTACAIGAVTFAGTATFSYAEGIDSMAVSGDLSNLQVDGIPVDGAAGYEVCGDQDTYWVTASGTHDESGLTFVVDGALASQAGVPVFGGTTWIIDGTGSVTGTGGTDSVTFTGLVYDKGDKLPKDGQVLIQTASGHTVKVVFEEVLWKIGQVEVTVDDKDPVTVPVAR